MRISSPFITVVKLDGKKNDETKFCLGKEGLYNSKLYFTNSKLYFTIISFYRDIFLVKKTFIDFKKNC